MVFWNVICTFGFGCVAAGAIINSLITGRNKNGPQDKNGPCVCTIIVLRVFAKTSLQIIVLSLKLYIHQFAERKLHALVEILN